MLSCLVQPVLFNPGSKQPPEVFACEECHRDPHPPIKEVRSAIKKASRVPKPVLKQMVGSKVLGNAAFY